MNGRSGQFRALLELTQLSGRQKRILGIRQKVQDIRTIRKSEQKSRHMIRRAVTGHRRYDAGLARVQFFAQFLARLEIGHALGIDLDRRTGARVASGAGFAAAR